MNEVGKPTTRCVVVANPANTNCLALATYASKLPRENFTCLTRLDQNRAISQLSDRSKAAVSSFKNITIWGNHSATQYPDVNHAFSDKTPVRALIKDDQWLNNEFLTNVQQRGTTIIKARKQSSVLSAANATVDHIRDWYFGNGDSWVNMGVISDGSYDIPRGLVFSFPVHCKNWKWTIVQGLSLDKFSLEKICATTRELLEEKKDGLDS